MSMSKFKADTCSLKLRPSLLIDGDEYPLATGHKKIDQLLEMRLRADATNVRGILEYSLYKVHDIHFQFQQFILTISREDGKSLNHEDGRHIDLDIIDPDDAGPDTWMECDITILSDEDDLPSDLAGKSIELIVRVEALESQNGEIVYKP